MKTSYLLLLQGDIHGNPFLFLKISFHIGRIRAKHSGSDRIRIRNPEFIQCIVKQHANITCQPLLKCWSMKLILNFKTLLSSRKCLKNQPILFSLGNPQKSLWLLVRYDHLCAATAKITRTQLASSLMRR